MYSWTFPAGFIPGGPQGIYDMDFFFQLMATDIERY